MKDMISWQAGRHVNVALYMKDRREGWNMRGVYLLMQNPDHGILAVIDPFRKDGKRRRQFIAGGVLYKMADHRFSYLVYRLDELSEPLPEFIRVS